MSNSNIPAKNKKGHAPRIFFFRHGETEWSLSGQHTSVTDIPLTADGRKRVAAVGKALLGPDRLVDLNRLEKIIVSPRRRALQTLHLLMKNCQSSIPQEFSSILDFDVEKDGKKDLEAKHLSTSLELNLCKDGKEIVVTEEIREWDYGKYEGKTSAEINKLRNEEGKQVVDKETGEPIKWSIWRDGCEGGELPADVTERIDNLIKEVIGLQQQALSEGRYGDIMIVAHGHILRSLTMRWLKLQLDMPISLILEAGGSGVLSYEHYNWDERALNLGGSFTVPE